MSSTIAKIRISIRQDRALGAYMPTLHVTENKAGYRVYGEIPRIHRRDAITDGMDLAAELAERERAWSDSQAKREAERAAAWDAKNRYGLPEEVPMSIESLAPIFAPPAKRPGWRDRVASAASVEELGRIGDDADQAVSDGKLTPDQREQLDAAIAARHAQLEEVTA